MRILFLAIMITSSLVGGEFEKPTIRFLEQHSLEDIKYNLRLDDTTFIYKDLFDKAINKECEGFIGYHGSSREYRIFQDTIRIVLEEVVGIEIPKDFYFLDIPCFRSQKVEDLQTLLHYFLPDQNLGDQIEEQLFPLNPVLYSNYNQLGFTSTVLFTTNRSQQDPKRFSDDLKLFFAQLGMDASLIDQVFEVGKSCLKDDRGVLLQLFDLSENYSFSNKHCYPAYPNGYPFKNEQTSSFFYSENQLSFPPEIKLLLTDAYTLNPFMPLKILRYDKMQSSVVKGYEEELRHLIQAASVDASQVETYREQLLEIWSQS